MVSNNNLPPLNALKAFEAYGRHMNMKAAADELCVTPSAVSRQLRQLEDYLGVKLLERVGRSTLLTESGKRYLSSVSDSLKRISSATDDIFPRKRHLPRPRILKIGCGPVFAEFWLAGKIGRFRQQNPDIELQIQINHNVVVDMPLDNVDVEVYTGHLDWPDFHSEALFQIRDFPVCSPALLEKYGSPSNLEELSRMPLLHEGSMHWWPGWLKAMGCQGGIEAAGTLVFDETLCLKLALAGEGVALVDDISAREYLTRGELIRPVDHEEVTDDWVMLLVATDKRDNPLVNTFCHWLQSEFNAP